MYLYLLSLQLFTLSHVDRRKRAVRSCCVWDCSAAFATAGNPLEQGTSSSTGTRQPLFLS